jgi:hypothetical protein
MNNNKYYSANFIIHLFYGGGVIIGFVYSMVILMIACFFPIPIITSMIFIDKSIKRWPKEMRNSKTGRETITCMIAGISGWYLAFAAVAGFLYYL